MTDGQQPQPALTELQKMSQLADENSQVICTIKSLFPFDLFPTVITVERTKVNVIRTLFIQSTQVQSILIEEIATIERTTSLFLSALKIHNKIPNRAPYLIKNLNKDQAAYVQKIIQGLMVSTAKNIDISTLSLQELVPELEKIGAAHASFSEQK
jgi:hypothetical protein